MDQKPFVNPEYTPAQPHLQDLAVYFRRMGSWLEGPDGCGTAETELCEKIEELVYRLARSLPPEFTIRPFPLRPVGDVWTVTHRPIDYGCDVAFTRDNGKEGSEQRREFYRLRNPDNTPPPRWVTDYLVKLQPPPAPQTPQKQG